MPYFGHFDFAVLWIVIVHLALCVPLQVIATPYKGYDKPKFQQQAKRSHAKLRRPGRLVEAGAVPLNCEAITEKGSVRWGECQAVQLGGQAWSFRLLHLRCDA
jgi:hypothetical protein